ncbi:hypothetical protein VC34_23360 [Pseudomonas fluorescens]|uniref:Uncharacterized protein n=1 Tax=Pseudomonas fluorescens TaxID=294 RepID=A0A0F4T4L2_PSEFL|nr:hypothetical protein VC34_23360 [Pseudomonas fluorescens]
MPCRYEHHQTGGSCIQFKQKLVGPEAIIVSVTHPCGAPIVGLARNDEPLFLSVQRDISFMMALIHKTIGSSGGTAKLRQHLAVPGKAADISEALFELPLILTEQPEFAIHVVFSSNSVAFGVTSSGKIKTYRKKRSATCH